VRLRAKTLLVVGLAMLVLFGLTFGGAYLTLTQRYREIERLDAQEMAARAAHAVADRVQALAAAGETLAARDDTYRFMETMDPADLPEDFRAESLTRRGFNFVIFLDKSGKAVRSIAIDLDLETEVPPSAELVSAIQAAPQLRAPGDPRGGDAGLLDLPGGVAVIASHSISSGDQYEPPRGTLVLGRYIDSQLVDEMSGATGLTLSALKPVAQTPAHARRSASTDGLGPRMVWWRAQGSSTYTAYSQLGDMAGDPVLLLKTAFPRTVRASMQSAILFAALALAAVCIVATVLVFRLVDHYVIRRLETLQDQVQRIARAGDTWKRVSMTGTDEIGELAVSVNGMLTSLQAAETVIVRARDELEVRVEQRTHELFLSDARHRELLERMADAVFSVDLDGRVSFVNQQAVELMGLDKDRMVGRPFVELMTLGSAEQVERHLGASLDSGESWTVEAIMNSKGRDPVAVELRAAPFRDIAGEIAGTQWIARDVTERQRFEQQLVHLATHDALTDLANRRAFETALEFELAEAMRGGEHGAVAWLDLDDFKDLNDTLGHAAGDEALVMLATVLRRNIRASNLLARVGGDEFAVMLPRVDRAEAEAAAERILTAITSFTCAVGGRSVRMGASVGLVFFPEDGATVQEVLSNADAAMYHAKEGGRSRVFVSAGDGESDQLHVSRMTWNERITLALKNDDFVVCAQPIMALDTGEIIRHELLIRMRGDEERIYPPSDFLPVAERLGLIVDIDRWMLRQAIGILQSDVDGLSAVEVNLSGKAFADSDIVPFIASAIDRAGVDPRRLGFEITETAAIADISRAQWFVTALKELGCRFSLDDFGTGFSSFYYLKHLPVDCIKIDGSYVRGLAQSEQDRCLVRGIREMCRGLGVEVLAECIEDEATLEVVQELGLQYGQGYHIGRPAPVSEMGLVEGRGL